MKTNEIETNRIVPARQSENKAVRFFAMAKKAKN
jgi:hypothetical protein